MQAWLAVQQRQSLLGTLLVQGALGLGVDAEVLDVESHAVIDVVGAEYILVTDRLHRVASPRSRECTARATSMLR